MKHFMINACLLLLSTTTLSAQHQPTSQNHVRQLTEWRAVSRQMNDPEYFQSAEAARIGDNLLAYQLSNGAFPKNTNFARPLDETDLRRVLEGKNKFEEGTIDNKATTTELYYLAHLYQATHTDKYKEAFLKGLHWLLDNQMPNGGWAQFPQRTKGYYTEITFNDNAIGNVMTLLRAVYDNDPAFSFVSDADRARCRTAFEKGIQCILKCQYVQDGVLTVWCAQHDRHNFAPTKARAYELPSLSGAESVGLMSLLMSVPNPSPDIIRAVDAAAAWFRRSAIHGLKQEYFVDGSNSRDYKMVPCTDCPDLWARFYDLQTNEPFFSGRDGIKRSSVSNIEKERRTGYAWYTTSPANVLKQYEKWKLKTQKQD